MSQCQIRIWPFIKKGSTRWAIDEGLEGESLRTSPPNRFVLVGVVSTQHSSSQALSMTLLFEQQCVCKFIHVDTFHSDGTDFRK